MENMFALSDELNIIFDLFQNNGYECFLVGGCVRDRIMGKSPCDFDIATNALPRQTAECFSDYKIIETGIKHGTVTVIINHHPFEITTYRIDGEYADSRHPTKVEFADSVSADLSRRDFTVNAMAYNPKKGLVDPFDGQGDIKNKIIRCVGDPDLRFNEDALRIMRALRFASVLDFEIEPETHNAIIENREKLLNISAERISAEFKKALSGKGIARLLPYYSVFSVIFPNLTEENFEQSLDLLSRSENKDEIFTLTIFFLPFAHGEETAEILKKLRFDNETVKGVKSRLQIICEPAPKSKATLKRLIGEYGYAPLKDALYIQRLSGKIEKSQFDRLLEAIIEIEKEKPCLSLSDLAIKGNDLINLGISPDKKMGELLLYLLDEVIDDKIENRKEILLTEAKKYIKNEQEK